MAPERPKDLAGVLERLVAQAFRRGGWRVNRELGDGPHRADLLVERGDHAYAVEVKAAPESRRDRVLPLLANAILQAQAVVRNSPRPVRALAIVGAPRVGDALALHIERFARDYAPDVAVGVVDLEGFQRFHGPGLESMNKARGQAPHRFRAGVPSSGVVHLFSDLNQWMLKVLLAPRIAPDLLGAPRDEYRNVSELAVAAHVSVMSAFRFVRQLQIQGFLDELASPLRLVRLEELLRRWRAESLRPSREIPMRWVLRGDPARQLRDALRAQASAPPPLDSPSRAPGGQLRACLGLFAAAEELGVGLVHGVAPYAYVERADAEVFERLGLSLEPPRPSPDVFLRIPSARESVFRGAVLRHGVPVSDVLQIWLDAGVHPSRGSEQADLIYRRVLSPLLERGRR
jgi:hypothetical protein